MNGQPPTHKRRVGVDGPDRGQQPIDPLQISLIVTLRHRETGEIYQPREPFEGIPGAFFEIDPGPDYELVRARAECRLAPGQDQRVLDLIMALLTVPLDAAVDVLWEGGHIGKLRGLSVQRGPVPEAMDYVTLIAQESP